MHWVRKDYCPKCETETGPIAWLVLISHINGGHSAMPESPNSCSEAEFSAA